MTPKLIYVGQPYSHPDPLVVSRRVNIVANYMSDKVGCKNGFVYYSPICHGQTIHLHAEVAANYEFWKAHSLGMLALASELHVLCLDGWLDSVGLMDEVSFAALNHIPIKYFNQDPDNAYNFYEVQHDNSK